MAHLYRLNRGGRVATLGRLVHCISLVINCGAVTVQFPGCNLIHQLLNSLQLTHTRHEVNPSATNYFRVFAI